MAISTTGRKNTHAAWPFPVSPDDRSEPEELDLDNVDTKLSELPIELQVVYESRIRTAYAVIDGVKGIDEAASNRHKNKPAIDVPPRAVLGWLTVIATLGAMGHYLSGFFYFAAGALFVTLLAILLLSHAGVAAERTIDADDECRRRELRYRWISNGFDGEDFDSLLHIYQYACPDDKGYPIFRKWWRGVQVRLVCELRQFAGLSESPGIPYGWWFD